MAIELSEITIKIRDWSKSKYGGGGGGEPEQRGGGSSVFEPLVGGGSFNFQLTHGGGSSYFITGIGTLKKEMIDFNNRTMILPEQLATHLK